MRHDTESGRTNGLYGITRFYQLVMVVVHKGLPFGVEFADFRAEFVVLLDQIYETGCVV